MRENRSTLALVGHEDKKPSICYGCTHYDFYIGCDQDLADALLWVHECKADFEPGDDIYKCDGFIKKP